MHLKIEILDYILCILNLVFFRVLGSTKNLTYRHIEIHVSKLIISKRITRVRIDSLDVRCI